MYTPECRMPQNIFALSEPLTEEARRSSSRVPVVSLYRESQYHPQHTEQEEECVRSELPSSLEDGIEDILIGTRKKRSSPSRKRYREDCSSGSQSTEWTTTSPMSCGIEQSFSTHSVSPLPPLGSLSLPLRFLSPLDQHAYPEASSGRVAPTLPGIASIFEIPSENYRNEPHPHDRDVSSSRERSTDKRRKRCSSDPEG